MMNDIAAYSIIAAIDPTVELFSRDNIVTV